MSDTENRSDAPAPEGEVIPSAPIQSDAAATVAPAKPVNRIADSSFEAAHAELPPLSALAADAPVATVESGSAAVSGARRGRGRGAPAGKSASGQPAKVAFGVVENPADLTENLSGKHAQGYADQPPRREREERKPYVAPAAREAAESVAAPEAVEASEASEPVAETRAPSAPKEFVPPVSEGTRKADLNPEAERQAREERRQRDDRPRGERQQGEGRNDERPRGERRQPAQGGEFRGEPQPRGERREFRENREPRENRDGGQRHERGERRDNNRGEQRNRPGRVTIEAPKIPVQEPTTFLGKLFRAIAQKLWGVPAAKDLAFDSVSRPITPHSKEWQFNRGQQRRDGRPGDNRGDRGNNGGQRRDFRQGNGNQGGDRNPNRDGRHRPHSRGGDHHRGGRDGGPRA